MNQTQTNRIEVVDALRGLALCAIVIVHCFEHYKINHHYLNCEDGRRWKNIVRDITGAGQVFEI